MFPFELRSKGNADLYDPYTETISLVIKKGTIVTAHDFTNIYVGEDIITEPDDIIVEYNGKYYATLYEDSTDLEWEEHYLTYFTKED